MLRKPRGGKIAISGGGKYHCSKGMSTKNRRQNADSLAMQVLTQWCGC
ncbi:hypothetical protein [Geomesophilobacter sediminis]|uniref:Uncharacterized protein n=1 Tax=Geomesophilobacter sediminis TaxID=2798584 RepID=A0A8J7LXQ6_9BACT|nr:hypothetical protein [Geomesophilobacter sediminis]MBJ6723526.1 hypothetical protein [Geomesophilobacter sediminis]